jgi:hypothetical protein
MNAQTRQCSAAPEMLRPWLIIYRELWVGSGGFTAAVPGLPNIQALKPVTTKKIIRAIVATAKLRSARCERSDRPTRRLAFIPISVLRPRGEYKAKTLIHAFRLSANVGLELKFQDDCTLANQRRRCLVAPMSGRVSQANEQVDALSCPFGYMR